MAKDDGGPAFPRAQGPNGSYYDGMSLRDWFAGHEYADAMLSERGSGR